MSERKCHQFLPQVWQIPHFLSPLPRLPWSSHRPSTLELQSVQLEPSLKLLTFFNKPTNFINSINFLIISNFFTSSLVDSISGIEMELWSPTNDGAVQSLQCHVTIPSPLIVAMYRDLEILVSHSRCCHRLQPSQHKACCFARTYFK